MINVLELIDGGFLGGGQTHILSIVKNIDKSKFNAIIAGSSKGKFKEEAINCGFEFTGLYLPKIYRGKYLQAIDEIVTDSDIQIIHSHGGVAGMYARFYKKKYGKMKVVHTIHGIHYMRSRNFLIKWFSHSIEQSLVKYTDKFICVSDEDKKLAEKMKIIDPSITTVIKNGIDVSWFTGKKADSELKRKLGIQNDSIVIGNISRFDFQKNQRMLIEAFGEVSKSNNKLILLLVGDGQYFDNCKDQVKRLGIEDKVFFTGEVPNVEDYYPLMDIFVFPSLWEGLSITLIEAMASGRCIIASDIPSNRELIADGKTGVLFSLKSKAELSNKIQVLLNDKATRTELARNAAEEARKYDEGEMTRMIMDVYNEVSP